LFTFLSFFQQANAQNYVLQLDGSGDYVKLPGKFFNNVEQATIEAWVKWDEFRYFSQPFRFGSQEDRGQVIGINNPKNHSNLQLFLNQNSKLYLIKVNHILRLKYWYHIAAVFAKKEFRLYLNGVLVGRHDFDGLVANIGNEINYFGKSTHPANDDFKGEIDEIRFWKVARTGEQIQASMYCKLKGNEEGLIGLWNFDSCDACDLTTNSYDGILIDDAHCIKDELPSLNKLILPAVLSGVITDENGNLLPSANLLLKQNRKTITQANTNEKGGYFIVTVPNSQPYHLSAIWQEKGAWEPDLHLNPDKHGKFENFNTECGLAGNTVKGIAETPEYGSIDFKTSPEKRLYRWRFYKIKDCESSAIYDLKEYNSVPYSQPSRETRLELTPDKPGNYIFEVQAIDRDLNYSEPSIIRLEVIPHWYLNTWVILPSGIFVIILLSAFTFLGIRYYAQKQESQKLRVKMLEQERQKNLQLQEAKDKAEKARITAEFANKAKSIFLANMSHEIRTPLNAILGYARLLQRETELASRHKSAIHTIEESGNHLLALINDVLDISKIEAGRLELQENEFDLTQLIHGLSVMFQLRCEQKGLIWKTEWKVENKKKIMVYGDEGKLRQILINLLSNAVKFTESGEVILRITQHSSQFSFEVIDTGVGILPEEQEAIFAPFTQGTSDVKNEGTGLGLAIAYKYVELMEGKLDVESELGIGSRFSFCIELKCLEDEIAERPLDSVKKVLHLAEGYSVKALVADDNQENREILSLILSDIGVSVISAEDGQQALEKTVKYKPDIVFMDIRMPVMDGFEAAKRILNRNNPKYNTQDSSRNTHDYRIPKLVAVSASALVHERERYFNAGFDYFIAKPISDKCIYECLAQLLHVKYETDEYNAISIDFSQIKLPKEILIHLKESAEFGRVTDLDRLLDEVEKIGDDGIILANKIRELSHNFNMDGVLDILGALEST